MPRKPSQEPSSPASEGSRDAPQQQSQSQPRPPSTSKAREDSVHSRSNSNSLPQQKRIFVQASDGRQKFLHRDVDDDAADVAVDAHATLPTGGHSFWWWGYILLPPVAVGGWIGLCLQSRLRFHTFFVAANNEDDFSTVFLFGFAVSFFYLGSLLARCFFGVWPLQRLYNIVFKSLCHSADSASAYNAPVLSHEVLERHHREEERTMVNETTEISDMLTEDQKQEMVLRKHAMVAALCTCIFALAAIAALFYFFLPTTSSWGIGWTSDEVTAFNKRPQTIALLALCYFLLGSSVGMSEPHGTSTFAASLTTRTLQKKSRNTTTPLVQLVVSLLPLASFVLFATVSGVRDSPGHTDKSLQHWATEASIYFAAIIQCLISLVAILCFVPAAAFVPFDTEDSYETAQAQRAFLQHDVLAAALTKNYGQDDGSLNDEVTSTSHNEAGVWMLSLRDTIRHRLPCCLYHFIAFACFAATIAGVQFVYSDEYIYMFSSPFSDVLHKSLWGWSISRDWFLAANFFFGFLGSIVGLRWSDKEEESRADDAQAIFEYRKRSSTLWRRIALEGEAALLMEAPNYDEMAKKSGAVAVTADNSQRRSLIMLIVVWVGTGLVLIKIPLLSPIGCFLVFGGCNFIFPLTISNLLGISKEIVKKKSADCEVFYQQRIMSGMIDNKKQVPSVSSTRKITGSFKQHQQQQQQQKEVVAANAAERARKILQEQQEQEEMDMFLQHYNVMKMRVIRFHRRAQSVHIAILFAVGDAGCFFGAVAVIFVYHVMGGISIS